MVPNVAAYQGKVLCARLKNNGQPGALSSRYARGPGKGWTTRVYCTQPYPAFLQEVVSTA